jgi:putative ABC transport system permease protein
MQWQTLLALAWRESRFARRRLFLFLSAISLGVAALVATQSFASGMSAGIRDQARTLLGADAAVRSRQAFGPRTAALLDSLRAAGVPVARVTSFASMALVPRTAGTRLVQVRAVEGGFPFYGTIETAPAGQWDRLDHDRNALVDPALLVALDAQVGDTLALGEGRFRISGTLERVPGEMDVSAAFAPRVFIPRRFLEETGLVQFGSRVEHEAFLQLPAAGAAGQLETEYGTVLREERAGVRTAEEQQRNLSEALGRLGSYLGLIGVFALLLGGIGVASAMGAYMKQKAATVATLRCLGATAAQVFAIYLLQATVMGLAGAVLGVALGLTMQWVLPRLLATFLPVDVRLVVDPTVVLIGLGVGVWVAVVFALLPLLETRRISPLGALRRQVQPVRLPGRDPWRWAAWAALGASAVLLVVLQAGEWRMGMAFAAGVAVSIGALWLVAWSFAGLIRRLRTPALPYTIRQGLANLHRPGNQTRVVVLSLGLGVFLLATLFLTQHNLLRPLRTDPAEARANLLLWDVQEDQEAGIAALLGERGLPVLQRAPIVPMRVAAINGRDVRPAGAGDADGADAAAEGEPPQQSEGGRRPEGWAVRREYRSTFRDTLVTSERLREGEWWEASAECAARSAECETTTPAGSDGVFPVSMEHDIAEDLGVGIGDLITWDVQGVHIPTRVTSLREVDWARFEPNFFAVFPTAALAGAPQTWIMLTRSADAGERARVQRQIVERFPNVAVVDLTQVQAALDSTLGRISLVIRFLAGFSIATGFVVLLGAVSTSRLERIRQSVLLKLLGARRRQIAAILFTEYLLLGVLASLTGIVLSVGAGWALARWQFELDFGVPAAPLALLGATVSLLAVAVGLWASRESYRSTPLEMLREE